MTYLEAEEMITSSLKSLYGVELGKLDQENKELLKECIEAVAREKYTYTNAARIINNYIVNPI